MHLKKNTKPEKLQDLAHPVPCALGWLSPLLARAELQTDAMCHGRDTWRCQQLPRTYRRRHASPGGCNTWDAHAVPRGLHFPNWASTRTKCERRGHPPTNAAKCFPLNRQEDWGGGASCQFQLNVLQYSLTEINSKNCVVYISINMGAITNNVSESQHSWWSGINNPVMIRWSLNSRQTQPSWSLLSITVCERRSSWDWCTGKKQNKKSSLLLQHLWTPMLTMLHFYLNLTALG